MKKVLEEKFDIYDILCSKIVNFFISNLKLSNDDIELIHLGIHVLLLNLFKFIILSVLAICLGLFKEVLLFIFIFALLRVNAAGVHLKSNIGCTLAILFIFVGSAYVSNVYPISFNYVFVASIFISILLTIYAPADTEKRPILDSNKRKELKIRSGFICILLLIINLIVHKDIIMNITMFALLIQMVSVNPITYKLMREEYNNYKKYE